MSTPDSVDITGIISNLQKLVLSLSQEHALDKTTKSTSRIRDMANCPDGTLSTRNPKIPIDPTAQLSDLQKQNADLKHQYEDCVMALNSMMHVHRVEMTKFVNSKGEPDKAEPLKIEIPEEKSAEEDNDKIPLPVFQDLDDVFQASGINQTKILREIELLRFENALIRELVQMETYDGIDVEALLDKIENQTPMARSPHNSMSISEQDSIISPRERHIFKSQETIKANSDMSFN